LNIVSGENIERNVRCQMRLKSGNTFLDLMIQAVAFHGITCWIASSFARRSHRHVQTKSSKPI